MLLGLRWDILNMTRTERGKYRKKKKKKNKKQIIETRERVDARDTAWYNASTQQATGQGFQIAQSLDLRLGLLFALLGLVPLVA